MTIIATIVKPGLQTTIQDAGRPGMRHLGVPQSGAADRISFSLANIAAGNSWNTPALECAQIGPTLKFSAPSGFALGGADMQATLNGKPAQLYRHYEVKPGDLLSLRSSIFGSRNYIAISGGISGNVFLGSSSTYLPAHIGSNEGRELRKNDTIETTGPTGTPQEISDYLHPVFSHDWILRATLGPEAAQFDPRILRDYFSTPFIAGRQANRMGTCILGASIQSTIPTTMKSSAVFPGTVQCPPDGNPFLLLADAQTVGGYPRIAQVISADIPLTGQIRPGDQIWFLKTSPETARDITIKKISFFASMMRGFYLD